MLHEGVWICGGCGGDGRKGVIEGSLQREEEVFGEREKGGIWLVQWREVGVQWWIAVVVVVVEWVTSGVKGQGLEGVVLDRREKLHGLDCGFREFGW